MVRAFHVAALLVLLITCSTASTHKKWGGLFDKPAWGVNTHWHYEHVGETAFLAAAGFRLVRTDLSWAATEGPTRGVYNFTSLLTLVQTLDAHGVRYLATLDYTNPLYDGGLSPYDSDGRAGFVAWVLAAVRFLRDSFRTPSGVLWELYNEPDLNAGPNCSSDAVHEVAGGVRSVAPRGWYPCANASAYALLAVQLGAALKTAFPDELYVGPALGDVHGTDSLDESFLGVCADAGALEWWDAVTVHPYRPFAPEDAAVAMAQMQAFVTARAPPGRSIPVFSGEWGYSTALGQSWGGPWANETMQGKYLPRMFMLNVVWGVQLSIWYDWHDDGANASDAESNFGITRFPYINASQPYSPKPAYVAAKTLANATSSCSDYAGVWRVNVSEYLTSSTVFECFAVYWLCGGVNSSAQALAVWCNSIEDWTVLLEVPVLPPAFEVATMQRLSSTTPTASNTAGVCFSSQDWLGRPLSPVCSNVVGAVSLNVSSGVTYLQQLQMDPMNRPSTW